MIKQILNIEWENGIWLVVEIYHLALHVARGVHAITLNVCLVSRWGRFNDHLHQDHLLLKKTQTIKMLMTKYIFKKLHFWWKWWKKVLLEQRFFLLDPRQHFYICYTELKIIKIWVPTKKSWGKNQNMSLLLYLVSSPQLLERWIVIAFSESIGVGNKLRMTRF